MRAIEGLRDRLTQRTTFRIIHNHRCPRDRLQREPLQADRAAKRENRHRASNGTKHAHEASEQLVVGQFSDASDCWPTEPKLVLALRSTYQRTSRR